MTVTIGQLRETVTFQRGTDADDTYGGQTVTWSDIVTVKAKITPVRSTESDVADRMKPVQTFLVEVRYRTDISTSWRLVWGQRTLNIIKAENRDMRRKFVTMECVEGLTE